MSNVTPNQSFSSSCPIIDLLDPRSPTTAFQRTPIQVTLKNVDMQDENTCEPSNEIDSEMNSMEAMQTSLNSCTLLSSYAEMNDLKDISNSSSSFLSANEMDVDEVNINSCTPSPIVSEFNMSELEKPTIMDSITIPETPKTIDESDFDLTTDKREKSLDDSFFESYNELKIPAKKLFYTPNKKRAPLLAVDNICPVTPPVSSPQNVLRQKQWKRIQEERKKLGLESDENIPIPLNDITASAPSKLMLRKKKLQARFI